MFLLIFLLSTSVFAQNGFKPTTFVVGVTKKQMATVEKVLAQNKLAVSDFNQIGMINCNHADDEFLEGFSGHVLKDIENKEYGIKKGSNVEFCKGRIESASTSDDSMVRFKEFNCRESFNGLVDPEDPTNEKRIYKCKIFKSSKSNGISIPEGADVIFSYDGSLCMKMDKNFSVDGVTYKKKTVYRVSDGVLTEAKSSFSGSCFK